MGRIEYLQLDFIKQKTGNQIHCTPAEDAMLPVQENGVEKKKTTAGRKKKATAKNKITKYFSPSRNTNNVEKSSERSASINGCLENKSVKTVPLNGSLEKKCVKAVTLNGSLEKKSVKTASVNGALEKKNLKDTHMTEYFPIRRSHRKPKTKLLLEKQKEIEEKILDTKEEGLKIQDFPGKGRGIVTTRKFSRGEMVVEYIGDLIDLKEAKRRENKYAQDATKGCYMYYFTHQNIRYCVDATEESKFFGRLVNHSRNGNLLTKTVEVSGKPHLILVAKSDIEPNVEILYDYGDRSKEALESHPWLAL